VFGKGFMLKTAVIAALVVVLHLPRLAMASPPEWWEVDGPAGGPAAVYGKFSLGCFSGGEALPLNGPGFQVMRPSRERYFGHPRIIRFVRSLAESAQDQGWDGLLVGDMAQARGGPMRTGHRSHQSGLDADIWFRPAPDRELSLQEREDTSAISMLDGTKEGTNDHFGKREVGLLKLAAQSPEVGRIFVHPAIKRTLCEKVGEGHGKDRDWLRKVRPWWGHHYHFHVRLRCPAGDAECVDQAPPPPGDGCDASLAWWFSDEAREKAEAMRKAPPKPRKIPLDALPAQCRSVLTAR
jgi:penicillin-insensitive murein endopeptidase